MATFKVGQRVKRVRNFEALVPLGAEGTVTEDDGSDHVGVAWDTGTYLPTRFFGRFTLAPLEDPQADAFLESIRKMKPYEEPKVAPRVVVS